MNLNDHTDDPIELRADPVTREIIDVADGIDRVMGNRALYARMLRRFRQDYRNASLPVRLALADGDHATAHRLVHTLTSASGMIGAHRLHQRATRLEHALRTGAADQREQLAALGPEFHRVLSLLDVLLEGSPAPGAPVHIACRPLMDDSALLERLVALLSNSDGAAVDMLEQSGPSLKVILGEATLLQVSEAVRQFKFTDALDAIAETADGSGI